MVLVVKEVSNPSTDESEFIILLNGVHNAGRCRKKQWITATCYHGGKQLSPVVIYVVRIECIIVMW